MEKVPEFRIHVQHLRFRKITRNVFSMFNVHVAVLCEARKLKTINKILGMEGLFGLESVWSSQLMWDKIKIYSNEQLKAFEGELFCFLSTLIMEIFS